MVLRRSYDLAGTPIELGSPIVRNDALRAAALHGFERAGRGLVVLDQGKDGGHYATLPDLLVALCEEPNVVALLETGKPAIETYDPGSQAIVFDVRDEAVYLLLIHPDHVETIGRVDLLIPM